MNVMGILAASIYGIFVTTEFALAAAGVSCNKTFYLLDKRLSLLDLKEEQFRTDRAIQYK